MEGSPEFEKWYKRKFPFSHGATNSMGNEIANHKKFRECWEAAIASITDSSLLAKPPQPSDLPPASAEEG